jgi:hypothetical protein
MKKGLAARLGFLASVVVGVLGAIYLLLLTVYFSTEGFVFPPTAKVQLVGGIVTLLTVPALVVLFTAIRYVNEEKQVLGSLGVSFIVLFAATVSINRFVQLTVVQQSLPDTPADLARFLPYSAGSVLFALEILGWGLFSSLAAVSVAPLFSATRLDKGIRWLLILYAVFSFMSVIGFATSTPVTAGAFIAWGPILLAIAVLLAIYFRNLDQGVS